MKPTLYKLSGCYRCGQRILDAANAVIRHTPDRVDMQAVSLTGHEGDVRVGTCFSQQQEIALVALCIAHYADGGSCPYEEAAVLLRTNKLVDVWVEGLRAAGIPVREPKAKAKPEEWQKAQIVVSLCANPENDRLALAFVAMAAGPEAARKAKAAAAAQMGSVSEVVKLPGNTLEAALHAMACASMSQSTIEAVEKLHTTVPEGSDLADLACAMLQEEPEDQVGGGVRVSTIHSFKGLEANDVYLPAFEDEIFPAKRCEEEETRICFVAFTRARNRLFISHCGERPNDYSHSIESHHPSRFIERAGLQSRPTAVN
jgi:superfamily I DNA/RNA helicase